MSDFSASHGDNEETMFEAWCPDVEAHLDGIDGALDSLHLGSGHRLAGDPGAAEVEGGRGGRRGHGGGTAADERERAARGEGGEAEGRVGQAHDGNHAGSRELRPLHHHYFCTWQEKGACECPNLRHPPWVLP